ncbi:MAG: PTS sugar transporter subunit IIC [Solobacterium sp.]|jgi:PTS system mannose-specific IIC component|nr:PTS sugar transporter subunit IIC [Solobacterium sp.]MCH4265920.1 PTS sugar transporter subunit IIC [Solobacterium sp.]
MLITWIQALLLGLVSCFAGDNLSPVGTTAGNYSLSRPLVASLIVGLILGDVRGVIMMAVPVQLIFIAMITPGGTMLADLRSVSYIGLPLAWALCKQWGIVPGSAVSQELAGPFAAVIGIIFVFQYKWTSRLNEIWQKKGWDEINQGNLNVLTGTQTWMPFISHLIASFLPVFLTTFFGSMLIKLLPMVDISNPFMKAVLSIGMVLPAIGIAIVLNAAVSKPFELLLFGAGFVLGAYFRLPILSCILIGSVFAIIDYWFHEPKKAAEGSAAADDDEEDI